MIYCGDPFAIYTNIELCHTLESNVMLHDKYTSIITKQRLQSLSCFEFFDWQKNFWKNVNVNIDSYEDSFDDDFFQNTGKIE